MNFISTVAEYAAPILCLLGALLVIMIFLFASRLIQLITALLTKASARRKTDPNILAKKKKKEEWLYHNGADYFMMKDGVSVEKWDSYKFLMAVVIGIVAGVFALLFKGFHPIVLLALAAGCVLGFFLPDLFLYQQNKSSNQKMLPDIMEISRSLLYGNRAGQYIGDSLSSACMIAENERLKTALIQLQFNLSAGVNIPVALDELESHFNNAEIEALCTVVRSLQETGQANDAIETLRSNISREQTAVNNAHTKNMQTKVQLASFVCFVVAVMGLLYILFEFIGQIMSKF